MNSRTETTVPVSVLVHTRNSADDLPQLLDTVTWADEIIVVDMMSTDETQDIASRYGARVLTTEENPRIDGVRNLFVNEARNEWVLVMDSDEYLADDAEQSVRRLIQDAGDKIDVYRIPRFNKIGGQVMRGSGWYPDYQARLFRRGSVRWQEAFHKPVELLVDESRVKRLDMPECLHIHHNNYKDLSAFISKQVAYALNDVYPDDSDNYDSHEYVTCAYTELARRYDPQKDGDMSVALSTLMAWDSVVRAIIHWDRLDPRPPLGDLFSLPVMVSRLEPEVKAELDTLNDENDGLKRELMHIKSTRYYRAVNWVVKTFPGVSRAIAGFISKLSSQK